MKAMKKIGAAALTLAMLGTSMSSMAFAAEEESYDFGGQVIKVYGNQWGHLNPESTSDETVYLEYAAQIEEKYNVKFEYVDAGAHGFDGYNMGEVVQTTINAGEGFANIIDIGPEHILSLFAGELVAEITEDVDKLQVGSIYTEATSWGGKCYGMSFDNIGDTYAMVYSRDFLDEIGMEETPTDKFMAGEWSYADMKEYLTEMKQLLPEGVYPIGFHWNHWCGMAGAANGAVPVSSQGLVNMTNEDYIASLEFYRELLDEGLAYPIALEYEGDELVGAEVIYGQGDLNTKIVLANSESWQFGGLQGSIGEWGLVFWPWGDAVTCETYEEGSDEYYTAYTTLSDNYNTAQTYWGNSVVLADAEAQTGIEPIVLHMIAKDYYDLCQPAGAAARLAAYEAEQAGDQPSIGFEAGTARNFCTEQDMELYDWGHTRVVFDWSKAFSDADIVEVQRMARNVMAEGMDARSAGESHYQAGLIVAEEMGLYITDVLEEEPEVETEESTEE